MDHTSLKDLVEFMAKALVDVPEKVEVNEIQGEQKLNGEEACDRDNFGPRPV